MIKHNIGLVRKALAKRAELYLLVKNYLESDSIIVICEKDKSINVSGRVSSTEMSLVMLGKAVGLGYEEAKSQNPDLTPEDYVTLPAKVALHHLEKELQL